MGSWPFVDREEKLAAALAAVADADPGAVIISGPPGVGRTRLAHEVLAPLRKAGRRTEWVTGTRATAAMQLDALGHLVGGADDLAGAWQALVTTLATEDSAGPAVLCVDDAHLLNDLCASLVHKLVVTGSATVVITLCSDAPAPDLIDALWRDDLAPRVELTPLTHEQLEQLLSAELGDVVESRTCHDLWEASRGSVVFLRELAEAGRSTGRLLLTGGIWRWPGELVLSPRLRTVVLAQIGHLSPLAQSAVELLVIGGSLELQDFVAVSSDEVVAGLERRRIVRVDQVGRRQIARLSQPLYAEVLRDQLPETLAARYRQQLAAAPSVQRWVREDPVQVAALLVHPDGGPAVPGARTRAAAQANARSDHRLAEQLARRALEDGPDVEAAIALAEALRWQGRHDEAEQVAAAAATGAVSEDERRRLATTRMLNAFFGAHSFEAAEALGKEVSTDASRPASSPVDVVTAIMRLSRGELTTMAELYAPPPSAEVEDGCLRLWQSAAATVGAALCVQVEEAEANALRGWEAWTSCDQGTETAFARALLMYGEVLALGLAGRVPDAEARAAELHQDTLARTASPCDAVAALGRGTAALLAGRARQAQRWLGEATVQLADSDPLGLLSLCWSLRAQAAAFQGDAAAARGASEQADAAFRLETVEPQRLLARAWTAAAEDRLPEAVSLCRSAADAARALDLRTAEAAAWHATVRLGSPEAAVPELRRLADQLDTGMARACASQAEALAAGNGALLDQLATEFAELGAFALAADAAAQAAKAHRASGRPRRLESASARRARVLAASVGGLRTPALERLTHHRTTSREDEVAEMAAGGASNPEIARTLVLSVRTVEAHLQHVYDKLGVNSRADLRDAMVAAGWLSAGPGAAGG